MLTRRTFLTAAILAAALVAAGPGSRAFAQADNAARAASFVNQAGGEIVRIVNSSEPTTQKRARMQQIVDRDADVEGVARFCLGRFWRTASPPQQQEYIRLFHTVLMNNLTSKIGEYQGVQFQVDRTFPREDAIVVQTTIVRPNNAPSNVQWVISFASGAPKIVDMLTEGVSLRLTQRQDYASYLAQNGNNVQALIEAMRRQVGA